MNALYIVGSIAVVLVLGFGASFLLTRTRRRGYQSDIAPMPRPGNSPYVQPSLKRIEEETKLRPPGSGPE